MASVGRPTKYDAPLHVPLIVLLKAKGLTDAEAAAHMGIGLTTLKRWKQRQPEFRAAEQMGREPADTAVEAAAFRRAVGYDYTETTSERVPVYDKAGQQTGTRMVVTKVVIKHQPADVTALIWWLKNRLPQQWRDRREVAVELPPPPDLSSLSDDDLRKLAEIAARAEPGAN